MSRVWEPEKCILLFRDVGGIVIMFRDFRVRSTTCERYSKGKKKIKLIITCIVLRLEEIIYVYDVCIFFLRIILLYT